MKTFAIVLVSNLVAFSFAAILTTDRNTDINAIHSTSKWMPSPAPIPDTIFMKKECDQCSQNAECLQEKCIGTPATCSDGSYESLLRCGFTENCGMCDDDWTCASMNCSGGMCMFSDGSTMCGNSD